MADESQYYNPIIQAMIQTAQMKQQQGQFQQSKELEAQRVAQQEQQIQDYEKNVQFQHDQAQQILDLQRKQSDIAMQTHQLGMLDYAMRARQAGAPDQFIQNIPGMNPSQGGDIGLPQLQNAPGLPPGIGPSISPISGAPPISISSLPGPSDITQQMANRTALIEQAKNDADWPSLVAQNDLLRANDTAHLNQVYQNDVNMQKMKGGNAVELENLRAAAGESEAKIRASADNYRTQAEYQLGATGAANAQFGNQVVEDMFNGNRSYPGAPTYIKRLADQTVSATGETGLPTDKSYPQKLDMLGRVDQLISAYRNLANNYSVDAPHGGTVQMMQDGQLKGLVPLSDLNSAIDTVHANGGTLGTFYDMQNRKSDAEILRQQKGLFDPTGTIAQNNAKINTQMGPLQAATRSLFVNMSPDRQNTILKTRGIVNLGNMGGKQPGQSQVNQPGKDYQIKRVDPNGKIPSIGSDDGGQHWFNIATGQPIAATAGQQ